MGLPPVYSQMSEALTDRINSAVNIVETSIGDWLLASTEAGWSRILQKLHAVVRATAQTSPTGKIRLIGHSSGGVMGRLYLWRKPFRNDAFCGADFVDHLITLGSPHYNLHTGRLRKWVDSVVPGAYYSPDIRYTAIAGKAIRGDLGGKLSSRIVYRLYSKLCGSGEVWGDGLVPTESALLHGAHHVVLDGVFHGPFGNLPWYGTPEVVHRWCEHAFDIEGYIDETNNEGQ